MLKIGTAAIFMKAVPKWEGIDKHVIRAILMLTIEIVPMFEGVDHGLGPRA